LLIVIFVFQYFIHSLLFTNFVRSIVLPRLVLEETACTSLAKQTNLYRSIEEQRFFVYALSQTLSHTYRLNILRSIGIE